MIYDIFKLKYLYFKEKRVLFTLFLSLQLFLLFGCTTPKWDPKKELYEHSYEFPSLKEKIPILNFEYIDINPYIVQGLAWSPFVLPIEPGVTLKQSQFLIGYWQEKDDPILPPSAGQCRFITIHIEKEKEKKSSLKLVRFESDNANPSENKDEIFFLLDDESNLPFAILKMNNEGRANCFIPYDSYRISTGFGQFRIEKSVEKGGLFQKVSFPEGGGISIVPSQENGILEGDIIRIGRSFSNDYLKQLEDSTEENHSFIPVRLNEDLFVNGNFKTKEMGIDEYLKTSLLVGKEPFNIELNPAEYIIAILRKNRLVCLKKIVLSANSLHEVNCIDSDNNIIKQEEDIFENEQSNFYIDTSFYPKSFTDSIYFQDWVFSTSNNFFSANALLYDDEFSLENIKKSVKKEVTFLFENELINKVYAFKTPEPINGILDLKRSSILNRYFAIDGSLNSEKINNIRNKSYQIKVFGIPFAEVGEEEMMNGGVPFSVFSKMTNTNLTKNFIEESHFQASNGTLFNIFEPVLFPGKRGVLSSSVQQKFRFRVVVPEWNSTHLVEMYLNGNFYRRWILNRGEISQSFSKTIEVTTNEPRSFSVRFVAYGNDYLPDFLTGIKNSLPFVITRDYCVDVIGDGTCQLEN